MCSMLADEAKKLLGPGTTVADGIAGLRSGLDSLLAVDLDAVGADEVAGLIGDLEVEARRLDAAKSDLIEMIDRRGLPVDDGFGRARVMVRHVAQLSTAEAAARDSAAELMTHLPAVGDAYRAGQIGTPQVRLLARVMRNPRVRDFLPMCEMTLLVSAIEMEYIEFERLVRDLQRALDEDGPADLRRHDRRDVRLVQDFDDSWHLRGRLSSCDGASVSEILDHFVAVERLADIDEAKAQWGDRYQDHLPRTEAQLRADAFVTICRLAAGAPPGSSESKVNTDFVIDQATFEHHLAKLLGADPDPLDPFDPDRRCSTLDGVPLDPAEVVARAMMGHVRRVVYDADGTVIDLGRRQRLFTGSSRRAALLRSQTCVWPGCWVRASQCQVDHLTAAADGGRTDPGNGAPMCGRHNRFKEKGYHVWRDPEGRWRALRPDGTEIPGPVMRHPYDA